MDEPIYRVLIANQRKMRKLRIALGERLKKYNLTVSHWLILHLVRDNPSQKISAIATMLDTSMAHVTSTVNFLVARGLVEKTTDPIDTRLRYVRYIETNHINLQEIDKDLDNVTELEELKESLK